MKLRIHVPTVTANVAIAAVEGWSAIELHRAHENMSGASARVARVIFWDAQGQFFFEAFGEEIPLSIAEDLIAEAKVEIRTK